MASGLADDVALVTASSQGLGKASAKALASEGAHVVVNGRSEAGIDDAVEEIDAVGDGTVVGKAADITDEDDIQELVEFTVDRFGTVDHLVTSTGSPPTGTVLELDDDDWYHAFDMLVMSVVRLVRAAESHLRDGGGTIVTITSTAVKEAVEFLALSNVVRIGVIGLEKTLSRELAPDVRVNAVLPGPHETDRFRDIVDGDERTYEEHREEAASDVPLGRVGQPADLGEAVAFLCSERSSYINGTALPVDGGKLRSTL